MPATLGIRSLNYGSPVNWGAPLNRNLEAWYRVLPLLSGGSTWHDLTGRWDAALTSLQPSSATLGWNSTRRLGGAGEVRFATGALGAAPRFRQLDAIPAFTWSVWVKQTGFPLVGGLVSKFVATATQTSFFTFSDNFLYFRINSSVSGGSVAVDLTPLWSAGWMHLVSVYDGRLTGNTQRGKIYFNGKLTAAINAGGVVPALTADHDTLAGSAVPLTLGRYLDSPVTSWSGALDDIRTWTRALSADEVRTLYVTSQQSVLPELTYQVWPPPFAQIIQSGTLRQQAGITQAVHRAAYW